MRLGQRAELLVRQDSGPAVTALDWSPDGEHLALGAADGLGARLTLEGETDFDRLGVNLYVLAPGQPIGMYHWESTQEDFLVLMESVS